MGTDRVNVLVLYSHALLGEGLERLLSAERSLAVHAVDEADETRVAEALADEPDVIVLEEGGRLEALDLMRRTRCPLLIDVSIGSSDAWTIRRDALRTTPDRLYDMILGACLGGSGALGSGVAAIAVVPETPAPAARGSSAPLPVAG